MPPAGPAAPVAPVAPAPGAWVPSGPGASWVPSACCCAYSSEPASGETPFGDAGAGQATGGPSFTKESPTDDVVDAEIIDEDK